MITTKFLFAASLLIFCGGLAIAQAPSPTPTPDCPAPIYGGKDVSRKAKITFYPPPEPSKDKRAQGISGTVVLRVVLCRSGQVMDIEPVRKLPYGIIESAIDAAKRVRFVPASKDGQTVSQRAIFEYRFDGDAP
jgi:TonB family protein